MWYLFVIDFDCFEEDIVWMQLKVVIGGVVDDYGCEVGFEDGFVDIFIDVVFVVMIVCYGDFVGWKKKWYGIIDQWWYKNVCIEKCLQ